MTRDAAATRRGILDAAVDEFAEHGLAGGRIDRIARASGANPKSIYAYFGSKAALFDAAVSSVLGSIGARVPLDPTDLPGFAGRLFDEILVRPQAVRLNRWRQLERPEAGPDDRRLYSAAVGALRPSPSPDAGGTTITPGDVVILALSLPSAWLDVSRDVFAASAPEPDAARIATHRAALVEAVRRISRQ